jgi:hypothetical protein
MPEAVSPSTDPETAEGISPNILSGDATMWRTVVAGVVGVALLAGTAFAEEIRGVILAYDKEAKTLKLKVGEEEKEFKIADDAKVIRKGEEVPLEKLKFNEKQFGKAKLTVVVEEDVVKKIVIGKAPEPEPEPKPDND